MPNRRKDLNDAKYLASLGYDATINEDVSPEARPRDGLFALSLTTEASLRLQTNVTDATLLAQREDWLKRQNDATYVPTHDEPSADTAQQELLYEVLKMASLDFPTVILDVDTEADFEEYCNTYYKPPEGETIPPDEFQRDSLFTTVLVVRSWLGFRDLQRKRNDADPPEFDPATVATALDDDGHPIIVPGVWRDRMIDNVIEKYPDEWPCQILFTRKIIYFASLNFVEGEDEPAETDLLGYTLTATDAAAFDPRVDHGLTVKSLRPTDGGLALTFPRSAIQGWINDTLANIDPPGAGAGDPSDPFAPPGSGSGGGTPPPIDPTAPPTGTAPPPTDGSDGLPPPTGATGDRASFDCTVEILDEEEGTNHTYALVDFSYSQNFGWFFALGLQALTPVNARNVGVDLFASVATAVEAWRVANHKPSTYTITRVVLCFTFQRIKRAAVLADGQESFLTIDMDRFVGTPISGFADPRPKLHIQRGSTGSDKIIRGGLKRLGEYGWPIEEAEITAVVDTELAEAVHATITSYDTVTALKFSMIDVPAKWDFWNSSTELPIIKIGLESADIHYVVTNWTGHFDLRTHDTYYLENPMLAGEFDHFSDSPDGLVNGSVVNNYAPHYWAGGEIAGQGNMVLSGANGLFPELGLLGKAGNYSALADGAYTKCTIRVRAIFGAQTFTLHVHKIAGGPGDTYTLAAPDTGHFSSTPYIPAEYTFEFDISASAIAIGDGISSIGLEGSYYLQAWSCTLS